MKKILVAFSLLVASVCGADITSVGTFPAGTNGEVQYNDRNDFGSSSNLTYSTTTLTLTAPIVAASTIAINGLTYTWPNTACAYGYTLNIGAGNSIVCTSPVSPVGGGGASTLAVNYNEVKITSPTVSINFKTPLVVTSVGGGTTSQITVDPSSVTLHGPLSATAPVVKTGGVFSLDTSSVTMRGPDPTVGGDLSGTISNVVLGIVDISAKTNLSANSPITLTGDVVGIDRSSATLLGPSIDAAELPSDGYAATYVNTTGDTMTGQLTVTGSSVTVTGTEGIRSTYHISGGSLAARNLSNTIVAVDANGVLISTTISSGAGLSYLGISSGSATSSVIVSSPTRNVAFSSNTFIVSLQGTTSSFITLNPSSATLQGQNVIFLTSTLQSGATMFVSSGTVQQLNATNIATTGDLTVGDDATITGGLTVNGGSGVTIPSLTASRCVETDGSGRLVSASAACGTGGGGAGGGAGVIAGTGNLYDVPYVSVASSNTLAMSSNLKVFPSSVTVPAVQGLSVTYGATLGSSTVSDLTANQMVRTNASKKLVSSATLTTTELAGTLQAAQMPALTGDVTNSAGSLATTLASVTTANQYGSSTVVPVITYDAKGRITAVSSATISGGGSGSGIVSPGTFTWTNTKGIAVSSITVSTVTAYQIPYAGGVGSGLIGSRYFTFFSSNNVGALGTENLMHGGFSPYYVQYSSNAMGVGWYDASEIFTNAHMWGSLIMHPNAYPTIAQGSLNLYARDGSNVQIDVTGQNGYNAGTIQLRSSDENNEGTPHVGMQYDSTRTVVVSDIGNNVDGISGYGRYVSHDYSAVLEATSTTKGFLPPRMTTTQKNAIVNPVTGGPPGRGMMVFDLTVDSPAFYNSSGWHTIDPGVAAAGGSTGQVNWNNAGTLAGAAGSFVTASSMTFSTVTIRGSLGINALSPAETFKIVQLPDGTGGSTSASSFIVYPSTDANGTVFEIYNAKQQRSMYLDSTNGQVDVTWGISAGSGTYATSLTVAGQNVCQANGTNCPTSSGGSSSLEVMVGGVRLSSPTATVSLIAGSNITLTPSLVGGTTAQITIAASGGGAGDNLGNHIATMTITGNYGASISTLTVSNTVTISSVATITALVLGTTNYAAYGSSGTITPDATMGNNISITLTSSATINVPINAQDFEMFRYRIAQDAAGSRSITLGSGFAFGTDVSSATFSTAASKVDYLSCIYYSATSKCHIVAPVIRGY